MNDDDDLQDLPLLDERARAASRGLHAHVRRHLDTDEVTAALPMRRRSFAGSRVAALAAVAALFVGVLAVTSTRTDEGDDEQAATDLHTGVLRPLGPRDGKDSVGLPVTVDPAEGLYDGDTVTVTGTGFLPGESVGIVQCAREAGRAAGEARVGVDGCNVGAYKGVSADDTGMVTGSFTVRRLLTTPATGTVDCAAEADRCLIGVGAISDYDRSGGHPLRFATDVAPVELPTASVTPASDLHDGDMVEVTVDGVGPNELVQLEVCSTDPVACWQTGDELEANDPEMGGTIRLRGLRADADGHAEGRVPVWRFLPGPNPSTFVDCAVSRCHLRVHAESAPPAVPLGFAPGGDLPSAPVLAVDRTTGLQPGDELLVHGSGFRSGEQVGISLCIVDPHDPEAGHYGCWGSGDATRVGDDGSFTTTFRIDEELDISTGEPGMCADESCTTTTAVGRSSDETHEVQARCDGVEQRCLIVGDIYSDGEDGMLPLRPVFPPVPVEIRFG